MSFSSIAHYTNIKLQRLLYQAKRTEACSYEKNLLCPTNVSEILAFVGLRIHLGLNGYKGIPVKDIFSTNPGVSSLGL